MSSPESVGQSPTPDSTADHTLRWAQERGFISWFSRETTSTNSIAKLRVFSASSESKPMLFLAERQTAGRGRGEHVWSTPPGALLSTWSYPLKFAPQPILSPLVGLALFNAARNAFPNVPFNLKAPNDLYVDHKKIAGLLIETVMMGNQVTCAVGLGFNAGGSPSGLADSAVGLDSLLPANMIAFGWTPFLTAWIEGLEVAFAQSQTPELSAEARQRLRDALNLHPLLTEKVLNVGTLGQIQTTSRLINWHDL
jgi:BirA family biotin operon repressor/biotin-[acetyl-CoA-carboxylase] ligase